MSKSQDAGKSTFGTPIKGKVYEANIMKLCIYTFVIGLGNIQSGFAISGNNPPIDFHIASLRFSHFPPQAFLRNAGAGRIKLQ